MPRRTRRNPDLLQAESLGAVLEFQAVNAIAVTQQLLRGRGKGEGLSELLGRPNRRRTLHDIEMQHPAAMMRKDQEDVEHLKVDGGDGEEIDGNHVGKVVAKESFPVVGRATAAAWDHIVGDGSLRYGDAELEQLAVNSWSTPQRISAIHFPYQIDDGWGNRFSTGFARPAFPSPEESKSRSMPSDDGAGLNQADPDSSTIPGLGEPGPQGSVDWSQPGSVGTPAQNQQLVAQSQVLQEQVAAGFQCGHDQTD